MRLNARIQTGHINDDYSLVLKVFDNLSADKNFCDVAGLDVEFLDVVERFLVDFLVVPVQFHPFVLTVVHFV